MAMYEQIAPALARDSLRQVVAVQLGTGSVKPESGNQMLANLRRQARNGQPEARVKITPAQLEAMGIRVTRTTRQEPADG